MKYYLIIFPFFSVIQALGQHTSWEAIYEVPQGKKGIQGFTKLLKNDSGNAELYWRRGYEHYRINQYNAAVPDFDSAIAKNSRFNFANVVSDRGLAKEMLGRYNEAIIDFSQAIAYSYAQDTTIPQGLDKFYYHRGRAKFKLGDTLQAISDLDSSLVFWDFHYYARKLRAMLLAMTGQYQKAMDDYVFLVKTWQGGGIEMPVDNEYAIDYYWRAKTKQALGDAGYRKDMTIAQKLRYTKFKITDLRGL